MFGIRRCVHCQEEITGRRSVCDKCKKVLERDRALRFKRKRPLRSTEIKTAAQNRLRIRLYFRNKVVLLYSALGEIGIDLFYSKFESQFIHALRWIRK